MATSKYAAGYAAGPLPPGVTVNIEPAGLDRLMAEDGPLGKWMTTLGMKILQAAQDNCREDTGQLKAALGLKVLHTVTGIITAVGVRAAANERDDGKTTNAEVALFNNFGTSRGVAATHFLTNALLNAKQ